MLKSSHFYTFEGWEVGKSVTADNFRLQARLIKEKAKLEGTREHDGELKENTMT